MSGVNDTVKKFRILISGAGQMGKAHAEFLSQEPDCEIVSVVRRPVSTEHETNGGPSTAFNAAMAEVRPDLAIIASPHGFHFSQVMTALKAGCHVLVEKPMGLSLEEVDAMHQSATERGLLLVEGLQRRYESVATTARSLINELGTMTLVHGLFAHGFPSGKLSEWRSQPEIAGQGIVDDSLIHMLDLMLFVAGGSLRKLSSEFLSPREIPVRPSSLTFTAITSFGTLISGSCSYAAPLGSVQEEISFYGTKGSLFVRRFCLEWNAEPPLMCFKSADGTEARQIDAASLPCGRMLPLKSMLSVLRGDAPRESLLSASSQTLSTHQALEAIRSLARLAQ